jgi:hypothetical protein
MSFAFKDVKVVWSRLSRMSEAEYIFGEPYQPWELTKQESK